METMEKVGYLINSLTSNKDHQQDLWVHYLSGNSVDTFVSHLEMISAEYSDEINIKYAIWQLMNNPPSEELTEFLSNHFSDFELSIMYSLMLGVSIEQISRFRGISQVRIRQTVANIRYNDSWRQFNGTKEKLNR